MGESRFDPSAGTLTLSPPGVAALAQFGVDPDLLTDAQRTELSEGGFFEGAALHPLVASLASTLAKPLIRLRLQPVGEGITADGWFGERLTLLLARQSAASPSGTASVLPRSLVPSYIARAVRLGPRSRPKVVDPVELDAAPVEALLASGEGFSARQIETLLAPGDDLMPAWLDVLAALSEGISGRWQVGVWWNSATEQPKARLLEVLDSEAGLFVLLPRPRRSSARRLQLRPVTPTQVWRLLCALVPPVNEVSEPLSP